jgi:hypothetical protein
MTTSLNLGGNDGSRLVLPVVAMPGAVPPPFSPPRPSEKRADIRGTGDTWPGDWTLARDEAHQKSNVGLNLKFQAEFPWVRLTGYEKLSYETDDLHPEVSSVRGEKELSYALKERTLRWRGHLVLSSDVKNFYYKYTRELLKDGQMVRSKTWEETVPRDHQ